MMDPTAKIAMIKTAFLIFLGILNYK